MEESGTERHSQSQHRSVSGLGVGCRPVKLLTLVMLKS